MAAESSEEAPWQTGVGSYPVEAGSTAAPRLQAAVAAAAVVAVAAAAVVCARWLWRLKRRSFEALCLKTPTCTTPSPGRLWPPLGGGAG